MEFVFTGFRQNSNVRQYSFDGIGADRTRTRFIVGADLALSRKYAIAMQEKRAAELGIKRISDLARHQGLKLGLSQEFLNRKDGWPALKAAYTLPHAAQGLDHGLAYEALTAGQVDVMDVYSTDAKITRYSVRQLEDALDVLLFDRSSRQAQL